MCPLCKQPFKKIIYNVRSDVDFDQYLLRPQPPPPTSSVPLVRAFRYRTTLTFGRARADRRVQGIREAMLRTHQQGGVQQRAVSSMQFRRQVGRTVSGVYSY